MLLPPQSESEGTGGESAPNAEAVREQLRRLLAHPLFTNSKRYPVLLAYTVEQALAGNAGELKERNIGVEAFGREPTYDVNSDPVVRMTAAEVRKRLVQYYYSPEHAGELVVELPLGCYVPCFREPSQQGSDPQAAVDSGRAAPGLNARHWISIAVAVVLGVLVGYALGYVRLLSRPSNLERFWAPITGTSGRVTFCLGEPVLSVDRNQTTTAESRLLNGSLDVSDVTTLARSIEPLVARGGAFRVVAASDAGFTQLREGPFVLIGAYDNPWTLRLTKDLPFGFEYDGSASRLVDRKSAQKRFWAIEGAVSPRKLVRDYAVVARIHDNVTGQPAIILAGIFGHGTLAASEVVSNPVYLKAMLQKAPKNWDRLNLEAVIETHVIEGHPGPPTVLAVETW